MMKQVFLFTLLCTLLASCSAEPTPPPVPTVDPFSIHTQVAQTMVAQVTQTGAAMPTPTVPPPPTATLAPPPTQALPALPPTEALPAASPTPEVKDVAALIRLEPMAGMGFNPLSGFDAIWTFQNIGDTVWNENYSIRWLNGVNFRGQNIYTFKDYADNKTVANSEIVTLKVPLQAGAYEGKQVGTFCLFNNRSSEGNGQPDQCIYIITLDIWTGRK